MKTIMNKRDIKNPLLSSFPLFGKANCCCACSTSVSYSRKTNMLHTSRKQESRACSRSVILSSTSAILFALARSGALDTLDALLFVFQKWSQRGHADRWSWVPSSRGPRLVVEIVFAVRLDRVLRHILSRHERSQRRGAEKEAGEAETRRERAAECVFSNTVSAVGCVHKK